MSSWGGPEYNPVETKQDEEIMECALCSHSGKKEDMAHWCWRGISIGILIWVFWLLAWVNGVFET